MKIREILQIELWSKRTTRKILVGLGILVASSFIVFWIWSKVELNWLTHGERVAAKAALKKIDELQSAGSLADAEYEKRRSEADAAIDTAERVAKTRKDTLIEMKLMMCSVGATSARFRTREQQQIEQGKLHSTGADLMQEKQTDVLLNAMAHQDCLELHKELD